LFDIDYQCTHWAEPVHTEADPNMNATHNEKVISTLYQFVSITCIWNNTHVLRQIQCINWKHENCA